MSTTGTAKGRQRRSPRLAHFVTVQIAGKGPDGKVFLETTRTEDLSQHGACLLAVNDFAIGAPLALRREGAVKPARARVVSIKPGPEPGIRRLGIEFVGGEGYWDIEFPESEIGGPRSEPPAAEAGPESAAPAPDAEGTPALPEEKLARMAQRIRALDAALEAVSRKSETVRAQADNTLREARAQREAAERQAAASLAAQVEASAARQAEMQSEMAAQPRAALQAFCEQAGEVLDGLRTQAAEIERKLAAVSAEQQVAAEAAAGKWQELWDRQEAKAAEVSARLDSQLERQRAATADLQSLAESFRKQTAATHAALQQETEAQVQSARGELRAAAAGAARDFRQQLPELREEGARFLAATLAEHQGAAGQLAAQSLDTLRAGLAEVEHSCRAALRDISRQAVDRFELALREKLQQAHSTGNQAAEALAGRMARLQDAIEELGRQSEAAIAAAREGLEESTAEAERRVAAAGEQRAAELEAAAAGQLDRIRQQGDAAEASAQQAARQLEARTAQVQEMGVALDRNARQKRQELEAAFSSLFERYGSRKEALDRLLEVLESGRAELRAEVDLLRSETEEQQGRLKRAAADYEAGLKARAAELEQALAAASLPAEAAFQQRVAATLDSFRGAFSTSLSKLSEEERQRLSETIRQEAETAAERIAALAASASAEQGRALEQAAAGYAARLDEAGRKAEECATAGVQTIDRRAAEAGRELREAREAAARAVEDRWSQAAAAAAGLAASAQQTRAAIAKESAEVESQMRQRQQFLETQLAGLFAELEEKRSALEQLFPRVAQVRIELTESAAAIARHAEQAGAALQSFHRDIQGTLEKRAAALGDQLRQELTQSVQSCEKELNAIGDAAQAVFDARVRSAADQLSTSVKKAMEASGEELVARLGRNLDGLRAEHERRVQELAGQVQQAIREGLRELQEHPDVAAGALNDHVQQISRLSLERIREAHEMILRDLPNIRTEGEVAFRQNLDRIVGQVRDEAAGMLRALVERISAEGELEMQRRLQTLIQSKT
jgi:hypothetical protein